MPKSIYISDELLNKAGIPPQHQIAFSYSLQLQMSDMNKFTFTVMEKKVFNDSCNRLSIFFQSLKK